MGFRTYILIHQIRGINKMTIKEWSYSSTSFWLFSQIVKHTSGRIFLFFGSKYRKLVFFWSLTIALKILLVKFMHNIKHWNKYRKNSKSVLPRDEQWPKNSNAYFESTFTEQIEQIYINWFSIFCMKTSGFLLIFDVETLNLLPNTWYFLNSQYPR